MLSESWCTYFTSMTKFLDCVSVDIDNSLVLTETYLYIVDQLFRLDKKMCNLTNCLRSFGLFNLFALCCSSNSTFGTIRMVKTNVKIKETNRWTMPKWLWYHAKILKAFLNNILFSCWHAVFEKKIIKKIKWPQTSMFKGAAVSRH